MSCGSQHVCVCVCVVMISPHTLSRTQSLCMQCTSASPTVSVCDSALQIVTWLTLFAMKHLAATPFTSNVVTAFCTLVAIDLFMFFGRLLGVCTGQNFLCATVGCVLLFCSIQLRLQLTHLCVLCRPSPHAHG